MTQIENLAAAEVRREKLSKARDLAYTAMIAAQKAYAEIVAAEGEAIVDVLACRAAAGMTVTRYAVPMPPTSTGTEKPGPEEPDLRPDKVKP